MKEINILTHLELENAIPKDILNKCASQKYEQQIKQQIIQDIKNHNDSYKIAEKEYNEYYNN